MVMVAGDSQPVMWIKTRILFLSMESLSFSSSSSCLDFEDEYEDNDEHRVLRYQRPEAWIVRYVG